MIGGSGETVGKTLKRLDMTGGSGRMGIDVDIDGVVNDAVGGGPGRPDIDMLGVDREEDVEKRVDVENEEELVIYLAYSLNLAP